MPGPGLLFGLLLAGAIIGGYIAHILRLPRVVGYLAAGTLVHVLLTWLWGIEPGVPHEAELAAAARPLKAIKDLGLGIILFSIGGVFEARHLRLIGHRITRISISESSLTFVLVFLGTTAAGLCVRGDVPIGIVVAFGLLLGFAAIATAPAATLFVLREYEAKGPTTDTILSLTGINNVVCIVTFYICFLTLASRGLMGPSGEVPGSLWLSLLATIAGSVALGVVLGFAFSIAHARLPTSDTLLILTAVLIVLGAGEGWLLEHHQYSFNFLLTALCMGAVFSNVAIDPQRLDDSFRVMGRPVLVGFFVIAGYELHIAEFLEIGAIGIVYAACRLLGKLIGVRLGLKWARVRGEVPQNLGMGLLCQAAVVLGLADFVTEYWAHPWARKFETVILGSVVFFEICGPLSIKWIATRAGEVKALTLLRRTGPTRTGSASILSLTWAALVRTIGLAERPGRLRSGALTVRDIMRSNMKCILASTTFNDVLHIVEESRFNHFPVVDEQDGLVGVVHFGQLREIIYDPALAALVTAVDLADPDATAVTADTSLAEAMGAFQAGDVGSLPVIESEETRRVVGILEQRDLLRAYHRTREHERD
jgi:CBS domain-containing protein/Kef-type K+ transport system membrane component KefB